MLFTGSLAIQFWMCVESFSTQVANVSHNMFSLNL